ncbi:hypothetical protein [Caldisericum sp.]|uniref:hypothetical protein n=1 Tax=Caldisericum sp. TaxID=2499687 RepID=UPI003D11D316
MAKTKNANLYFDEGGDEAMMGSENPMWETITKNTKKGKKGKGNALQKKEQKGFKSKKVKRINPFKGMM